MHMWDEKVKEGEDPFLSMCLLPILPLSLTLSLVLHAQYQWMSKQSFLFEHHPKPAFI